MVLGRGEKGRVPNDKKGVDGGSNYRGRVSGRPRLGWMDGVKVALGSRGMTLETANENGKHKAWSSRLHLLLIESGETTFAWFLCHSDRHLALW